ncbi:MAG TPA: hypothetical protein DCK87_06240 [Desulfotomaculum sp.]|nr:hypothetical protein [Desulfotomaculum sp.]
MKDISELLAQLTAEFGHLIKNISIVELNETETSFYFKAIFTLIDRSTLRVAESANPEKGLTRYSYYWLTTDGDLVIGWDNAPHHKKINTYPHHKHLGGRKIEPSIERDLLSVMSYISKYLTKDGLD